MVSDQQIAELLDCLLRETNPGAFNTLSDVVHLLQSRLGFDLSHKIDLIRARVTAFYSPRYHHLPPPPPQLPSSAPPIFQQTSIFTPSHPHVQYQLSFPQPQAPVFHSATEISFSQPSLNPHASTAPTPAPATKEGSQSRPKRRGGAGGLNKLCGVSPELETIVGQPAMTRTEIVKQLWVYIRKNNLQDPSNKRKIICNEELRLLFETDATDMFQMNKLLSKHILPLPSKDAGPQSKKVKVNEAPEVKTNESNPVSHPKNESNPVEALANFVPSEREMPQPEMNKVLSENSLPLPSEETVPQPNKEKVEEHEGKNTEPNSVVLSEALMNFLSASGREMPLSEMNKVLSENSLPLPSEETAPQPNKEKVEEHEGKNTEPNSVVLSEALMNFLSANGREMPHSEVFKRLSDYIRAQGLEDPITSVITCDAKLQKLLGCERSSAAGIYDMLTRNHLFQIS